jgi:hypothetical protein
MGCQLGSTSWAGHPVLARRPPPLSSPSAWALSTCSSTASPEAAPLNTLIGQCLAGDSATLVEGEGIHPSLAPHHPGNLVRFALVLEPEEAVLFRTLAGR